MAKKKRKRKVNKSTGLHNKRDKKNRFQVFLDGLYEFCDAFGARGAIESLPLSDRASLFDLRFRPVKLQYMPGLKAPRGLMGVIKDMFEKCFFKKYTFFFKGYPAEIPMSDYFTFGLTILLWFRGQKKDGVDVSHLQKNLQPLLDLEESKDNPERQLETYMEVVGGLLTEKPWDFCCYFTKKTEIRKFPDPSILIFITLKMARSDIKMVKLDGHTRQVFLVTGWDKGALVARKISADIFGKNSPVQDLKLRVYIQKHALDRLYERLDVFLPSELYAHVMKSIEVGNAEPAGSNRILLGYYFYGHLLGYLLIEVVDGIAVIRTFLFLTNDSTPQGKNLAKLLKVNKLDKSFTGLDKLSTYLHGDLKEDEQLYGIMKKADCSILLNLDAVLVERSWKKEVIMDAMQIKKYLELEKVQQVDYSK